MRTFASSLFVFSGSVALAACGGSSSPTDSDPIAEPDGVAHTLFVAHEGSLVSYDLATGDELPGAVQDVATPVDLQVLDDASLLVNLTERGEVLVVDGKTMLEIKRIPSSSMGGKRPVHGVLTPPRDGAQYALVMNDGTNGDRATNTALFIDVTEGSPTRFEPVGEVGLGVGHHKAAFSTKKPRVVISNIGDCDEALAVFDYSDLGAIKKLASLSAADLGFDGSSYATTCDPTYQAGQPPSPHGCATSAASGRAYCNVTATGQLVAVDLDADPPTFTARATKGAGGGYTKPLYGGGEYIYSLQEEPREGSEFRPGADCQIGQLVVIDAKTDGVVNEVPVFYEGPDCTKKLAGTDEATVYPGHMQITHDRSTLVLTLAGGFGVADARSRRVALMALGDPAKPVQLRSVPVGASTSHAGDFCAGDGRTYGVVGNVDGDVSILDATDRKLVRTVKTKDRPLTIGSFSSEFGPSHQTGPIE